MVAVTEISERLQSRPDGALFRENPVGSGLMEYLQDAADWVEDPPGSGLLEWVGG